jgi:hypothetical protein
MGERGRRPWRFAAGFTLAVFGIVSFLPVWTAVYIGDWELSFEPAGFWEMVASLHRINHIYGLSWVFDHLWIEVVKLIGLLSLSLGLGRWLGGR